MQYFFYGVEVHKKLFFGLFFFPLFSVVSSPTYPPTSLPLSFSQNKPTVAIYFLLLKLICIYIGSISLSEFSWLSLIFYSTSVLKIWRVLMENVHHTCEITPSPSEPDVYFTFLQNIFIFDMSNWVMCFTCTLALMYIVLRYVTLYFLLHCLKLFYLILYIMFFCFLFYRVNYLNLFSF